MITWLTLHCTASPPICLYLSLVHVTQIAYRLQDGIAIMRSCLVRLYKNHKMAPLLDQSHAIDIEIARFDLRRQAALDDIDGI